MFSVEARNPCLLTMRHAELVSASLKNRPSLHVPDHRPVLEKHQARKSNVEMFASLTRREESQSPSVASQASPGQSRLRRGQFRFAGKRAVVFTSLCSREDRDSEQDHLRMTES